MKQRCLLSLLLIPALAHTDALSTRGENLLLFALLMLELTVLVVSGFLLMVYRWPRWPGVPYVLGVPLRLLTLVRLQAEHPGKILNLVWLLALLLNGLVWARKFWPKPLRVAGGMPAQVDSS